MTTYRAWEVTGNRTFRLVDREVRDPEPHQVRLRVQYCGICHTDVLAAEGLRARADQPVIPGHEIVGVIDAVGPGITDWHRGERVGVGFLAGHCGTCGTCRRGDFVSCRNQDQTGTTTDGGYAEIAYARTSGLVRIPRVSSRPTPLCCCAPA
ncbi:alcohol dehydrogenase catalytic domain-containing protein [Streptomyces diastatochromogenes]|nr:alcohol dehydrogenase catalytic domain-containing protein [Streptomyces diastatochromogenes]